LSARERDGDEPGMPLSGEMMRVLRHQFAMYDLDHSGLIDTETELGGLLRDLGFSFSAAMVSRLGASLSQDSSSAVSYDELRDWFAQMAMAEAARRERRSVVAIARMRRTAARLAPPPSARPAIAWLGAWVNFAFLCTVAIASASSLGPRATRAMLLSWGLAEVQTLSIEESLFLIGQTLFSHL
jgi:hypothetical protein